MKQKSMSLCLQLVALVATLTLSTFSWADEPDAEGNYEGYNSLVNELKASAEEPVPVTAPRLHDDFDWDDVAIHGGIGLATSWTSLGVPGASASGLLRGVSVNLGMNLFSRRLRAEGAFGEYSESGLDNGVRASLKEFELRFVYMPTLTDHDILRFGTGVAARYMNISLESKTYNSSTPASLLLFGLEHKITNALSLGPDISYRAPLVADSMEKSAWDASFRLNATF